MDASQKLPLGHWLSLIPRDPPAEIEGLRWVVWIDGFDAPLLRVLDGDTGFLLRVDENVELAVRETDGSVWEIGDTCRTLYGTVN